MSMKPLNVARRAFFRKAAVTAAAVAVGSRNLVPLAGQAAEASLAGVAVAGGEALGVSGALQPGNSWKTLSVLRVIGIPDFKKKDMRSCAAYGRLLDPDIACLRSVSLGAKLRLHHERNYARMERDIFKGLDIQIAREAFNKLHGTDLW